MTTIESVYGRLRDLMTDDFEKVSSRQYKAASDPFSFDLQPRSDFDAWYVDPPATWSTGYVGGVENVEAQIGIWVSREAGEGADGAAVALAGDLARLRHQVLGLTFERTDRRQRTRVDHGARAAAPRRRGDGDRPVDGRARLRSDQGASVVLATGPCDPWLLAGRCFRIFGRAPPPEHLPIVLSRRV